MKLNDLPIFKPLSDEDVKEIQGYVITESYRKKESIFSEGDSAEWLYIVQEGKVKITKLSQDGKEIILELIHPEDVFGAIAVLKSFPYPANAVAMENSKVLKISKQNLMRVLDRFPEVMSSFIGSLGERLRDSHETTKNIALEKVSSRIAALLLKLSEQMGTDTPDGREIGLKLTKQDIAEMVGTTVETSIRTMSRFKKDGTIIEKAGKIIIVDPSGLEIL
ncbi:Crp/Fnr family transcriptional regulator [Nitrospirota bacterium]